MCNCQRAWDLSVCLDGFCLSPICCRSEWHTHSRTTGTPFPIPIMWHDDMKLIKLDFVSLFTKNSIGAKLSHQAFRGYLIAPNEAEHRGRTIQDIYSSTIQDQMQFRGCGSWLEYSHFIIHQSDKFQREILLFFLSVNCHYCVLASVPLGIQTQNNVLKY